MGKPRRQDTGIQLKIVFHVERAACVVSLGKQKLRILQMALVRPKEERAA